MIKILPTPRNRAKYEPNFTATNHKNLPGNWVDFARLCDIRSSTGIVKLDPYEYQRDLIAVVEVTQTTVIGKTRQLGITEILANYLLFRSCHDASFLGAFFSLSATESSMIAKRLRRQINSLESAGYLTTSNDNITDIQIEINGVAQGRILFRNSSPNGTRGIPSLSFAVFDECGFVPNMSEIYKSSVPATAMLGDKARIVLISTPNGQSGFFWDKISGNNGDRNLLAICEKIRAGQSEPYQQWHDENGIAKVLIHWRSHPIYSQEQDYLASIQKRFELPTEVVAQEYDLSFTDTQTSVFSSALIRDCATGAWQEFENDSYYYMGLDSSLAGDDYTVLTILKENGDRFELVAWYRQRKKTHQYNIFKIRELIEKWQPVRVGVETNGCGQVYFDELSSQCLDTSFQKITTTASSKPAMVNRLVLAMERSQLSFPPDKYILEEFLSFRQSGNKFEAQSGKHDDIICSLMFAIAILSTN